MTYVAPGAAVLAINDHLIGQVRAVRHCCFDVQTPDQTVHLTGESVFTVEETGRVTLVCMPDSLRAYFCGAHEPLAEEAPVFVEPARPLRARSRAARSAHSIRE